MSAISTPDLRLLDMLVMSNCEWLSKSQMLLSSPLELCSLFARKPGMTHDDLFNISAGIVQSLCTAIAKYCPNATVNMINNPVNLTVPIAVEVFKKAGTYDPKRLFGVTTLDVVRSSTFYAGMQIFQLMLMFQFWRTCWCDLLPLFSQATLRHSCSHKENARWWYISKLRLERDQQHCPWHML